MKPDTELDKLLWQRETTKQLKAALQLGFPSCPLQVLAVFMAFANAMALRLYQFEQKTTHWVSPARLPIFVFIYALKTSMTKALKAKKDKDGSITPNMLATIHSRLPLPQYANHLNGGHVVAIARLVALTKEQHREHSNSASQSEKFSCSVDDTITFPFLLPQK